MRSPEEVAREWLGLQDDPRGDLAVETIAALLRQRDAEHEERRREERGRAFDAGADAASERELNIRWAQQGVGGTLDDLNKRFDAARRAAVERAGKPGEEEHGD